MSTSKLHYFFVGNPGAGKSTLANTIAQTVLFKSGMSFGGGLTDCLDMKESKGTMYVDTPGLADLDLRKAAAKAISAALKKGGLHKVIFVCLLVKGRVRAEDLTTIQLVLDACPEIKEGMYGIIVNQCGTGVFEGLQDPNNLKKITTCLLKNLSRKTHLITFLPEVAELDEKYDAIVPMETLPGFDVFLRRVPDIVLTPGAAAEIDPGSFEEMKDDLAKKSNDFDTLAMQAAAGEEDAKKKYAKLLKESEDKIAQLEASSGDEFRFFEHVVLPIATLGTSTVVENIMKRCKV